MMTGTLSSAGNRKTQWGIGLAIAAVVVVLNLPTPDTLPAEGHRLAAIFLAAIILWATEAIPIAVTALLVITLQPIFGVTDLHGAFAGFVSPVFFLCVGNVLYCGSGHERGRGPTVCLLASWPRRC